MKVREASDVNITCSSSIVGDKVHVIFGASSKTHSVQPIMTNCQFNICTPVHLILTLTNRLSCIIDNNNFQPALGKNNSPSACKCSHDLIQTVLLSFFEVFNPCLATRAQNIFTPTNMRVYSIVLFSGGEYWSIRAMLQQSLVATGALLLLLGHQQYLVFSKKSYARYPGFHRLKTLGSPRFFLKQNHCLFPKQWLVIECSVVSPIKANYE